MADKQEQKVTVATLLYVAALIIVAIGFAIPLSIAVSREVECEIELVDPAVAPAPAPAPSVEAPTRGDGYDDHDHDDSPAWGVVRIMGWGRGSRARRDGHVDHAPTAGVEKHHSFYAKSGYDWKGLCMSGMSQSPINLVSSAAQTFPADMAASIDFGTLKDIKVMNNGHSIVFSGNFDGAKTKIAVPTITLHGVPATNYRGLPEIYLPNKATLTAADYTVQDFVVNPLQFHTHSPSEHTIDGKFSALEIHIVSQTFEPEGCSTDVMGDLGCLVVVGIMVDLDENDTPNPTIDALLPNHRWPSDVNFDHSVSGEVPMSDLLPADLSYYTYSGSLTTPPCLESVYWHVLKTPITASSKQIFELQNIMQVVDGAKATNRFVTPTNGRSVGHN